MNWKINKTKWLILVLCALSIVGVLFPDLCSSYIGFLLLGFHTPRDSIYYFMIYAGFSNYPKLAWISMVFLFIFLAVLFIAIKNKDSRFLGYFIIGDGIVSICRMIATCAFMCSKATDVPWDYLVALGVKNILCISIFIFTRWRRKKILIQSKENI